MNWKIRRGTLINDVAEVGGTEERMECGTCHMASPFTSLQRTAISTIFSEALLSTSCHQLPQALAESLLKHIIIMPHQQALFHATSCISPAITDALFTTSAPLPRSFAPTLIKRRLQPSPAW